MARKTTDTITVPVDVALDADLSKLDGALKRYFNNLNQLDIGKGLASSLAKRQTSLQTAVSEARILSGKQSLNESEVKQLDKLKQQINKDLLAIQGIEKQISQQSKLRIKDLVAPYEALDKKLTEVRRKYERFESLQSKITSLAAERSARQKERDALKVQDLPYTGVDITTRRNTLNNANAELRSAQRALETENNVETQEAYAKALEKARKAQEELNKAEEANKSQLEINKKYDELTKTLAGLETQLKQLRSERVDLAKDIVNTSGIEGAKPTIDGTKEAVEALAEKTQAAKAAMENTDDLVKEMGQGMEEMGASAASASNGVDQLEDTVGELTEQGREIENLTNRFKQFFTITNGIMLFRRAIRDAVQEIKVLDQAMTATAVVSQETVSSMWSHLPEYTENASKLGVAIEDVVSAQTLFVQQGLDLNTSLELATETLKMARIAGIDAANATSYMTAALRGFNMELNETSAQRINDVYSELAKITASDTREISVAMTKVASIANNANMSFENTAAFLAQIVNIMATYNRNIVRIIPNMRETPQSLNYFRG